MRATPLPHRSRAEVLPVPRRRLVGHRIPDGLHQPGGHTAARRGAHLQAGQDRREQRRVYLLRTLNNQWTSRQLHDAIQAGRAGRWIDGDPAPGLQPLPVPEPEKSLPAGRVLNRIARSAEELESLTGQWRQLQGKKRAVPRKAKPKRRSCA